MIAARGDTALTGGAFAGILGGAFHVFGPARMSDFTLYHNPRCSKSQATLKLLDERGVCPNVVEYQKTPPTRDQLQELSKLLGMTPRELIRATEPAYRNANLDDPTLSDEQLINAIVNDPILLQRPIVVANGRAVIGRPPENVLDIL